MALSQVVVDRLCLVGVERADDDLHIAVFDELPRLWQGLRLQAAGVGRDELDPAAGQRAVALLEELGKTFFQLLAAGGERAGADGEEADLEGLAFCPGGSWQQGGGGVEGKVGAASDNERAAGGNNAAGSGWLSWARALD